MPRRDRWRVRLLDEEGARENQNVRPEQVLNLVEDARIPRQFRSPRHEEIRHRAPFHLPIRVYRRAYPRLVTRYTLLAGFELFLIEQRKRREKSVVLPLRDLVR